MKRAYVFVLREKQREILPRIMRFRDEFDSQQPDDEDNYLEGSIDEYHRKIENEFEVQLTQDEKDESLDPEYLAGVVAGKLLERDPPTEMIPRSS